MTRPTVGWYVHHHGHGHVTRFLAIRPHLDADVVCFSSLPEPSGLPAGTTWVRLATDDGVEVDAHGVEHAPAEASPSAAGLLHWAPLGHRGHRSRLARIADGIERHGVDAFVVDVSVEVTLFVRLLGVPVVVVAQPGDRSDTPHLTAYRAATRILAPYPEGAVDRPRFDGADVVHTGGISRFDGRAVAPRADRSGVLVLLGSGGGGVTAGDVDGLRTALTGETVTVLEPGGTWRDDPWPDLTAAAVVIAWAGQNSVADLAAADARAVVIPQPRPFDEQVETGQALERLGLAVVQPTWPTASRWADLVETARRQEPDWSAWRTQGAARRAAAAILDTAARWAR